jgi:hypothetical protein
MQIGGENIGSLFFLEYDVSFFKKFKDKSEKTFLHASLFENWLNRFQFGTIQMMACKLMKSEVFLPKLAPMNESSSLKLIVRTPRFYFFYFFWQLGMS